MYRENPETGQTDLIGFIFIQKIIVGLASRRHPIPFTRVWSGDERLGGVFFWNWWGEGGPACHDYTPRGKPAEQVLRRWLTGQLPAPGLRP